MPSRLLAVLKWEPQSERIVRRNPRNVLLIKDWRVFADTTQERSPECKSNYVHHGSEAIVTDGEQEKLRSILHDLSNVMTGVLMSGGLLRLALRGDGREHHAMDVCDDGERGAALVREARGLVTPPAERLESSGGTET